MIDTSNIGLSREIESSEKARDRRIKVAMDLKKKYHTAYFSSERTLSDSSGNLDDPSNFVYQYVQTIIPQIVFSNPVIDLTSRKTGNMEALAAGIKQGINRWIQDHKVSQILRHAAYDSLFPFGVVGIFQGEDPEPYPLRISQNDFIRDHYALTKEEMRYTGHRWWIGKQELLDMALANPDDGWDTKLIRSVDLEKKTADLKHRGSWSDGDMPKREELVLYDIVIHGEVVEGFDRERFPSTIHTCLVTGEGEDFLKRVRKPRPYYGWGMSPYHIFDYGYIPDETYGLSPIVANTAQAETLNRYLRGTLKAMLKQKNLVLVDDADSNFASKIVNSGDQTVIPVAGFDKDKLQEISVGGISEQHLPTAQFLGELLDRNLGLSDAQRGVTPSGVSATASQLAQQGTNVRVEDMEQTFYERTSNMLESVAFYYWDNPEIKVPLGRDAVKELMEIPKFADELVMMDPGDIIYYEGGDRFHAPDGSTFDDMELRVQPHSMRRVSEDLNQQRGLQMIQVVAQLIQLKAQAPGAANYEDLAQILGDQMNIPNLGAIMAESETSPNGAPSQQSSPTGLGALPQVQQGGSMVGQSAGNQLGAIQRG